MWLGVTEYLFRNDDLLDEAINTAIEDNTFRSDDLEFTFAARVSCKCFLTFGFLLQTIIFGQVEPQFASLRLLPGSYSAGSDLARPLEFFSQTLGFLSCRLYMTLLRCHRLGLIAYLLVPLRPTVIDSRISSDILLRGSPKL